MENQKIFNVLFWILIFPVFMYVKTPISKILILCFGIVHALYSAPWPQITLILTYPVTLIMICNGYKNECYLSILIGLIVFIGHYLKDLGIVDYYYFPS